MRWLLALGFAALVCAEDWNREMAERLDYLQKLRLGVPNLGRLTQEIERLSLNIQQAQRELQAHRDGHGCS